MNLTGIVYWVNRNHFVARIIDKNKLVWIYDSMYNNGIASPNMDLTAFSEKQLSQYNGFPASLAIYARQ